jgi:putative transposase
MLWARMLSYVTGTVNQELLLRNEYLGAENRILRGQIKGRLLLSGDLFSRHLTRVPNSIGEPRHALVKVMSKVQPSHLFQKHRKLGYL